MKTLNCNGKLISVDKPLVMGIVNITPDSFYIPSRVAQKNEIIQKITQYIQNGVDIIDIGAVSTRPNTNEYASEDEEMDRVAQALEIVYCEFPQLIISCDTFRAKVAKMAVENYGVSIINDISGGIFDPLMIQTIAQLKVPYVLMHNSESLTTMHNQVNYDDIVSSLVQFFTAKIQTLRALGIKDIIIDPGFGFAKTPGQNFDLLKRISYLRILDCLILVGLSRKSMFYKTFQTSPEESMNASSIANYHAIQSGASILRVHDIREAKETIALFDLLKV